MRLLPAVDHPHELKDHRLIGRYDDKDGEAWPNGDSLRMDSCESLDPPAPAGG
jgi:hypothetical protein